LSSRVKVSSARLIRPFDPIATLAKMMDASLALRVLMPG